jgi:hypothetical protein
MTEISIRRQLTSQHLQPDQSPVEKGHIPFFLRLVTGEGCGSALRERTIGQVHGLKLVFQVQLQA